MQLFSVDTTILKRKKDNILFAPENMKKPPSKVTHNRPQTFFFMYWPGCPNGPETDIPHHQKPFNAEMSI